MFSSYKKPALQVFSAAVVVIQIAGCTSAEQIAQRRDADLSASGFSVGTLPKSEEAALMKTIYPFDVVQTTTSKGKLYLFADEYGCHCLWTGDEAAHEKYEPLGTALDNQFSPNLPTAP